MTVSFKELAQQLYASGKKGNELIEALSEMKLKPSAADLCSVLLVCGDPCINDFTWLQDHVYGGALIKLLGENNPTGQLELLYEVQKHCFAYKFPRIQTRSGEVSLIARLFQMLYTNNVIEPETFITWSEDTYVTSDRVQGKESAIIQTTAFILTLKALVEESEVDESTTVSDADECTPLHLAPTNVSLALTNKDQRQQLKRERRIDKLSQRD